MFQRHMHNICPHTWILLISYRGRVARVPNFFCNFHALARNPNVQTQIKGNFAMDQCLLCHIVVVSLVMAAQSIANSMVTHPHEIENFCLDHICFGFIRFYLLESANILVLLFIAREAWHVCIYCVQYNIYNIDTCTITITIVVAWRKISKILIALPLITL